MTASPALVAERLSYAYRRGRPVLRDVSFDAANGEILAILGTSGSGKTTLLKLCRGLLPSQAGLITVFGQPVVSARGALDPRIAYIPQQLGLVRSLSVMQNILIGALAMSPTLGSLVRLATPELTARATDIAGSLGIAHKLGERAYALSGGERQRVAIARALLQRPQVLLADEFISQLDLFTTGEIMRLVRAVADQGVAVIMTTHEQAVVRDHADRAIVLRDGGKVVDVRTRTAAMDDITAALRR